MNNGLLSPDLLPLLKGLKPFLPHRGKQIADGVQSLVEMLTSGIGQSTLRTINDLAGSKSGANKSVTVNLGGVPITLNLGSAFTLFLILILLILATNLGGMVGTPAPEAPATDTFK